MLLKKFNSLVLFFGLIGSLACHGVSGAGKVSHVKDDYIYISGNEKRCKRSDEKANTLLSTVKKKLGETKDFIFENSGAAVITAVSGILTPAAVYAGCKVGQRYFNKKCEIPATNIQLENPVKDKMDTDVPVDPAKNEENIENGENSRVSNHTLPGDSNNNTATSPEEKNSVDPSDGSIKNEKSSEDNAENLDPAANNGEVLNSSGNVNVLDEDKNLNKKSVFLGVYSEPIIYLSLKLTPQSWGLQKAWYDFWHYEKGRFSEPLKLILAVILWVGFCLDFICLISTFCYFINKVYNGKFFCGHKKCYIDTTLTFIIRILSSASPVASRLMGIFCESLFSPKNNKKIEINRKDRLAGAILGYVAFNMSVGSHNKQNIENN